MALPHTRQSRNDVTVANSNSTSVRNALITAALCAPLSLVRSCSMVLALIFGLWATTANGAVASDLDTASRVGLAVWLAGFGSHLDFAGGSWTLLPIGISAMALWSAHRAGRRGLRDLGVPRRLTVGWFLGAFLVLHTCGITLLGWWLAHEGVGIRVGQCAIAAAGFTVAVVTALAVSDSAGGVFSVRLPAVVVNAWAITRRVFTVWLLAATAMLLGVLIIQRQQVAVVSAEYGRGAAVAIGVALVSLVLAPSVVGWLMSLSAGGAVSFAESRVSAFGDTASALPPLPVMAAMPTSLPTWSLVLVLGLLALYALVASRTTLSTVGDRVGTAVVIALMSGALGAAIVFLCSGRIGYPQWSLLGPTWSTVAFIALCAGIGSGVGLWQASRSAAGARA